MNRTLQDESRRIGRFKTNQDAFDWPRWPFRWPLLAKIQGNAHKFARICTSSAVLTELEQGRGGDPHCRRHR